MTLTPITVLEGSFPTVLPLDTDLKEEIPHILCNYDPFSQALDTDTHQEQQRKHMYISTPFQKLSELPETVRSKSEEFAVSLWSIDLILSPLESCILSHVVQKVRL